MTHEDKLEAKLDQIATDVIALRHDMVRLESKIDSKPSLMAMFTGILITVFGVTGVIASTIGTLNTLGLIK